MSGRGPRAVRAGALSADRALALAASPAPPRAMAAAREPSPVAAVARVACRHLWAGRGGAWRAGRRAPRALAAVAPQARRACVCQVVRAAPAGPPSRLASGAALPEG